MAVANSSKDARAWRSRGVHTLDGSSTVVLTNDASGSFTAAAVMLLPTAE